MKMVVNKVLSYRELPKRKKNMVAKKRLYKIAPKTATLARGCHTQVARKDSC